jgi:hypothetical protein
MKKNRRELSKDEQALLRDEPLPPADDEIIVDDDWAEFRKLSPEEQKWALIQLQLDREQKYMENISTSE